MKIIEAMINNIIQIPKISGGLLSPITTLLGLKQGDNLSPILFYIFFDDVEEILITVAILLNSLMEYQSLALC